MIEAKDLHVNKKGYLLVGDGHEIYWEDWGNRKAFPIMHLHGGPGAGFNVKHKLLYNPKKHRVIFHDQRGCGQSKPFASIRANTTQHLIEDIEKLREHLKINKMYLSGGSWGSTLALLYAITHPDKVKRMMLWSIYLARQFETDHINQGKPKIFFPEAWDRFISLVPEKHRTSGQAVMQFYFDKINSKNKQTAKKYSIEWTLWEATLLSLNYEPMRLEREITEDKNTTMAVAALEIHYLLNKCFVPENYILDNISGIKHIPCHVVHGRFDMCTPPISALDLSKAYGDKLNLQIVRGGHLRTEPEVLAALRAAAASNFV